MSLNYIASTVPVSKLKLDLGNPRLYHETLTGNPPSDQDALEASISGDPQFTGLLKSIRKNGVQDAIWVQAQNDGTYLVVEGNRRTTCLRRLIRENVTPPAGVDYEQVRANVLDGTVTEVELKLLAARLQTGKAVWGPFNVSALIYDFHNTHNLAFEDIATEMQMSVTKVKKFYKSYLMFLDYSIATGDTGVKRFAYYNEAPKKVIEWVEDSPKNKKDYHKWINPNEGHTKIRSAATRGGLREFAKVIEDHEALTLMREDPMANVEDAMEVVKQNDIKKEMPFLAKLLPFQASLNGISDEQKARIAAEARIRVHLKSLRAAVDSLLSDLEAFDSE